MLELTVYRLVDTLVTVDRLEFINKSFSPNKTLVVLVFLKCFNRLFGDPSTVE